MKKIIFVLLLLSFVGCSNTFERYKTPDKNTTISADIINNENVYSTPSYYLRGDVANLPRDKVREVNVIIKFLKYSEDRYEVLVTTKFSARELSNNLLGITITTTNKNLELPAISNTLVLQKKNYMSTGYNIYSQTSALKINRDDLEVLRDEDILEFIVVGENFNIGTEGEVTYITPINKKMWPSWNSEGIKESIDKLLKK